MRTAAQPLNGPSHGLVAITCPCYWVSPLGAICLGAVAGVLVILGTDLLEYLRIDDPCGALAGSRPLRHLRCHMDRQPFCHGCGFGAPTPTGADNSAGSIVEGLFCGGGTDQLVGQIIGNAAIGVGVFVVAMVSVLLAR